MIIKYKAEILGSGLLLSTNGITSGPSHMIYFRSINGSDISINKQDINILKEGFHEYDTENFLNNLQITNGKVSVVDKLGITTVEVTIKKHKFYITINEQVLYVDTTNTSSKIDDMLCFADYASTDNSLSYATIANDGSYYYMTIRGYIQVETKRDSKKYQFLVNTINNNGTPLYFHKDTFTDNNPKKLLTCLGGERLIIAQGYTAECDQIIIPNVEGHNVIFTLEVSKAEYDNSKFGPGKREVIYTETFTNTYFPVPINFIYKNNSTNITLKHNKDNSSPTYNVYENEAYKLIIKTTYDSKLVCKDDEQELDYININPNRVSKSHFSLEYGFDSIFDTELNDHVNVKNVSDSNKINHMQIILLHKPTKRIVSGFYI